VASWLRANLVVRRKKSNRSVDRRYGVSLAVGFSPFASRAKQAPEDEREGRYVGP
jgi:hypothetical protein